MGVDALLERVDTNPRICHGQPRVKGTRIMLRQVLEDLAEGLSPEDMCGPDDFPDLSVEDVHAWIAYASRLLAPEDIQTAATSEAEGPTSPTTRGMEVAGFARSVLNKGHARKAPRALPYPGSLIIPIRMTPEYPSHTWPVKPLRAPFSGLSTRTA